MLLVLFMCTYSLCVIPVAGSRRVAVYCEHINLHWQHTKHAAQESADLRHLFCYYAHDCSLIMWTLSRRMELRFGRITCFLLIRSSSTKSSPNKVIRSAVKPNWFEVIGCGLLCVRVFGMTCSKTHVFDRSYSAAASISFMSEVACLWRHSFIQVMVQSTHKSEVVLNSSWFQVIHSFMYFF